MKTNSKLKTFLIATIILFWFGAISSIIILVTAHGEYQTKDYVTFGITGGVLLLDIIIFIYLIIKNKKEKDGNNNNQ